jgi:hypothetical protein
MKTMEPTQAAQAQAEEANGQPAAAVAVAAPPKKKHKSVRTHQPHHDDVYRHFNKSGLDKSRNTMVVCIYCDQENEEAKSRFQSNPFGKIPQEAPKAIRKRANICQAHLTRCAAYRRAQSRMLKSLSQTTNQESKSTVHSVIVTTLPGTPVSEVTLPSHCTTITQYYAPLLDRSQSKTLNRFALEFIIDTHSPFNIVERPSFHRLLDFLRPKSSQCLLSRFTIGGNQLNCLYAEALERRNAAINSSVFNGEYFGWIVDGWEMANSEHVEGVLFKSVSAAFLLDALEGLDTHHAISIARQWEEKVLGADIILGEDKGSTGVRFPEVSK